LEAVNKVAKTCPGYYSTTVHFYNLFLHRWRKSHCIRPSSGQAVANSALGSKSLAAPGLDLHNSLVQGEQTIQ